MHGKGRNCLIATTNCQKTLFWTCNCRQTLFRGQILSNKGFFDFFSTSTLGVNHQCFCNVYNEIVRRKFVSNLSGEYSDMRLTAHMSWYHMFGFIFTSEVVSAVASFSHHPFPTRVNDFFSKASAREYIFSWLQAHRRKASSSSSSNFQGN